MTSTAGVERTPNERRFLTVLRRRAQLLTTGTGPAPADVVRHFLGMQGQDYPGVLWSVGLRSGASESEVTSALERGELVRSWPLRGTLHLVAAEDLRWLLDLTGTRTIARTGAVYRDRELDEATLDRAWGVLSAELAGGRRLPRATLFAALAAAGIDPSGQRGITILGNLALKQLLVLGPPAGRQPTYALLEEWVARADRPERDEALGRLALRYFTSHGPATVRDLAWWSGLTLTEARRGRDIALPSLATLDWEPEPLHLSGEVLDGDSADEADTLLLPGFDEYVLGYRDRSAAIRPEHMERVVPGKNGMFSATMVRSGEVVGTWRRARGGRDTVGIDLQPFSPLEPSARARFEQCAASFGRFHASAHADARV